MNKKHFIRLMIIFGFILMGATIKAQEFPIAVGSENTFSAGAVYGGENFLVAVQSDGSINAQLVSPEGALIGPRISLGSTGLIPGAIPEFDGTNYFLVWNEYIGSPSGKLKGQLISTSGSLVGNPVTISTNVSIDRPLTAAVIFADTEYFVVFVKTDNILYGQRVSRNGNLIGSQIQISNNYAREVSLAYDGTNYLVTWVEKRGGFNDKDIYGQFVSKDGSLVGSNFLIDGSPYESCNPLSLAFDGTRYLLVFHDQSPTSDNWFLLGRFISTSGTIGETITICEPSEDPFLPSVAFVNNNYLITWSQRSNMSLMGRFYNKSGNPIDTPFVIFGPLDNKLPIGLKIGFGGGKCLIVASRLDSTFSDGDVYGRIIQPVTEVEDESNLIPEKFVLFQNYPNPFNPSTNIEYRISSEAFVTLKVYDILGNEVATLVNEEKPAGKYKVNFDINSVSRQITSGVYIYKLRAGKFELSRKMILMK
ncbi:MAG: T9SS type A sorting domain-containing protein [Candidatus Kapaibacteriales bacterium]